MFQTGLVLGTGFWEAIETIKIRFDIYGSPKHR
jgi:hypothetical protein